MVEKELERLLRDAKSSPGLKRALVESRNSENPVEDFCALCAESGYDVSIGELFAVGQNSSDAKLRSVNGGGVNAIEGWDDAYEQFFAELLWT